MAPPSTRLQERRRTTRSASPAAPRGRGRGAPSGERRGRATPPRGTRSVPPASPRHGTGNPPFLDDPVTSQTANAGESLLPPQLPTGSRPPPAPTVPLPLTGLELPSLGDNFGATLGPRASQITISMEDIRTISRQTAREEVELAKDSLKSNYQDIQSSLVSTVVPIVIRMVQESIHERVEEEIDQATLRVARQPQTDEGNLPIERSERLKTRREGSFRTNAATRDILSRADETVPGTSQHKGHEDARKWVEFMRDSKPSDSKATEVEDEEDLTYPGLKVIRPLNDHFTRALSYKTYRLRKKDNSYNDEIAQGLSKTARKLKHVMTVPLFDGVDSIAVLAFLKNYKFACDETGVSEGAALPLMKYFMAGEAKDTMLSYVGRGTGFADTEPGVDAINSYPEAVQWLLITYARESVLQVAYREVATMTQRQGDSENEYALRLRKAALRCGDAFTERNLIATYIEGLGHASHHVIREDVALNPRMTFQEIRMKAQSLGDTQRETHRIMTRLKPTPSGARSSRKGLVLSMESKTGTTEEEGDEAALAVITDNRSYAPSSVSVPTTTPPGTPSGGEQRHTEETASGQRRTLPRGMYYAPNTYRNRSPGPHTGQQVYPKTSYPTASAGSSALGRNIRCIICRKTGHVMTQCYLIPAEVRMQMKDAQSEHPFSSDELKQFRALLVEGQDAPEGGKKKLPSTGSNSSSDSDSEGQVPGNGTSEGN